MFFFTCFLKNYKYSLVPTFLLSTFSIFSTKGAPGHVDSQLNSDDPFQFFSPWHQKSCLNPSLRILTVLPTVFHKLKHLNGFKMLYGQERQDRPNLPPYSWGKGG